MSRTTPFPLPRPARIAVLASGRGSNLVALLAAFPPRAAATEQPLDLAPSTSPDAKVATVALVVSNVDDAPALDRAREVGVPAETIPWRGRADRSSFESALQRRLDAQSIDLVCLAGFMRILSPSFVAQWSGRILNVHPSLLPKYPGLEPQRRALEAGESASGCTVHFVDDGVDTGPPIVQAVVEVVPGDTVASLTERILAAEHRAYPEAVRRVLLGESVHRSEP